MHGATTKNIQKVAQNVQLEPPDVTFNVLTDYCGKKMPNYALLKNDKIMVYLCFFVTVNS